MIRSELIHCIVDRHHQLTTADVDVAVKVLIEAMVNGLATGRHIEIRGFGSFDIVTRPPRNGRNPKSGNLVMVPARRALYFRPGKQLRDMVEAKTVPLAQKKSTA